MRKNLFFISVLFLFIGCGTTKMIQIDKPVVKTYTDLTDNQDNLFIKANDWMISMFKDASSVIQFSDKQEGVLIGKYLMSGTLNTSISRYGNVSADSRVYAKIDIRVKDNRARISIEPMDSWKYDGSGLTIYDYSEEDFHQDIDKIMLSFENALKTDKIDF